MVHKSKRILSLFLILLLLVSIAGCSFDNVDKSKVKDYFDGTKVAEENKILGEIILSLFPEEMRKNNVPIVSEDQTSSNLVFTLFKLDPKMLDSYAFLTSTDNTSLNTIAIVVPKIGYEIDVLMGLENRIVNLLEGKEKAEQDKILDKVILEQYGLSKYIVLVLHENSEQIYNEICNGLATLDSSQVNVIEEITDVIEITE